MAQIASAYPTAGGLYHWGSILGNRGIGWVTAWLNLIGLVTVLGAINVGTFNYFSGAFGSYVPMFAADYTDPVFHFSGTYINQFIFVVIITGLQAIINHVGIKFTSILTDFSGYILFFGSLFIAAAFFFSAPTHDWARLITFTNYSGTPTPDTAVWPQSDSMWLIFGLGLLLPIYTITGYDASAHTSEETKSAAINVPKSIISSVVWSSLIGWALLSAIILAIPSMEDAAKQGWNVFFWTADSVLNPTVKMAVHLIIFISQFLCGLATVTSVSRMMFAFSRDGGLPFSGALKSVSKTYRTPVNAIWVGSILAVIFTAFTSIYTVIVSVTVIFLFLSFAVPIVAGAFAFGKKWNKMGPWNIGVLYIPVAILVVIAMAIIFYIGVQPPNDMALKITVGFLVLTAVVWFVFERNRFQGPPIGDEIAKRQAAIKAAEAALGGK